MRRRRAFERLMFLAIGLLLSACGGGTTGGTAVVDAGVDTGVDVPPPIALDLVISVWAANADREPGAPRAVYGFNLDNRFSSWTPGAQVPPDCAHGDHFSTLDPDQNQGTCVEGVPGGGSLCRGGVDNQFPVIVGAVANFLPESDPISLTNRRRITGRSLYALRVRDINGTPGPTLDDRSVEADLVRVWAAFPDCALLGSRDQPFALSTEPPLRMTGSVVRGRLRLRLAEGSGTGEFPVPGIGDDVLTMPMRGVVLRVGLTPEGIAGDGNLGGYVRRSALLELATPVPGGPRGGPDLNQFLTTLLDLATPIGLPVATCSAPEGAMGVGLGFGVARIRILPAPPIDRPAPGHCGSAPR